jgi:transposase InsO family protein
MANGQVDTITEAYWISLKIGTRTFQGKFHHLPHLPSDLVLGIYILRRYPFSIELKGGSASLRSPAGVDPTPNRQPWETVSTDLVGPLPHSSRGNCYVVVMQDRFIKWVQCRAVRKAAARAVTQALYEVITRFGCPVTVISDNGTQYSGGTFRTLLQELGIAHRLTPPYTPQANPVERTNKTLKTMVPQFCEADQKKWDARLPELMFALNTSHHESTRRYTPALLNFGRELVIPNAVHRPAPGNAAADDEVKETDDAVHHSERLRLLKDTFELVRVNLARAFTKQSKYYNLRHRKWRCHPGDRVLKRDHPLSSGAKGFAPKYSGPYTVTKVLSPVVYNLQSPSGQKILRNHIKDLKPYQMPELPAEFTNICRMPNQRIPPPPNGLQSVRQQLDRRLAGQADLMQAAQRAALKIRERFRRAPRNPQEGRTENRTTRDVRSMSAPPQPNPMPVGPTASGEASSLPQTSKPSSDTDLPPTATTSTWTPPCHSTFTTAAPAATTVVGITALPTQANCQHAAPPVSTSEENQKHPPCPRGMHPRQPRRRRMRRAPTGERVLRYVRPDGTPLAAGHATTDTRPVPSPNSRTRRE